jgi:putative ABC transport system permease protein
VFFTLCLALGVAAITGVRSIVAAVEDGMLAQSRELMGADLTVESRAPIPAEVDRYFEFASVLERVDALELDTVAVGAGKSRLVEVKAVGPGFPLYGEIGLEPPARFAVLLTSKRCAVARELLDELELGVGDTLTIGGEEYEIAAAVTDEPGRLDISFTLGPRVFLSLEGLARTKLESYGSRVSYRALYRLAGDPSDDELRAARDRIEAELPDAPNLRVQSHRQAQRTVRRALERVERYLGLAALLSLVLGGTGVAQIVRAWLATRTQAVAVLRVIGFRPREVLAMYLGHVALLALAGSFAGALAGSLLPFSLPAFAPDLLPQHVSIAWQPASLWRGVLLGVAIALVFSVLPLTAIWRVAPSRVLRVEAEPLAAPRGVRWSALALLGAGVFAAAWAQSRELDLAAGFTAGLLVLAGVLALGARGLTRLAAHVPRGGLDPYLRHGVAALARPGAGVTGATVALGLGVLVVAAMTLIERRLSERLRTALPSDAPSVFLLDVQPDQWAGVEAILEELDASSIRSVPVVTARLSAIDGRSVQDLTRRDRGEGGERRPRWALTREQRLTWMTELTPDNHLVEGTLWSDPGRLEVSLERDYARELDVGLGSLLSFDVQGVPVELVVTSLRTVDWESFGINFFLVAEPGALDEAPHFLLAAARLAPAQETRLQDELAVQFSNVTPIRVRAILEKVQRVLERLAVGVHVLGLFTALTGLAILAGVASSTSAHRGREVALWKTLGLTRLGVIRLLGLEYALVGLVAGLIGALGAYALSWVFLDRVIELPPDLPFASLPLAALATAFLASLAGLLASTRALTSRPIESLRG